MSKASLLPTLLAFASSGIALGLWMSQPENLTPRVHELESKLREAEETIARLRKYGNGVTSLASASHLSPASMSLGATTPGYSPASSGGLNLSAVGSPVQQSVLPAATEAASPAATPPPAPVQVPVPHDSRTMKKLAEAEARYADLINQFQLAPNEKEYFKQLAAKRSDIRRTAAMKLQDPTLTPAERKAIYAEAAQEMKASSGSVRQFLNNDSDFQKFVEWEQTDVERGQMEVGRAIFENNQSPLTGDQEEWLLDSLSRYRKSTPGVADPYDLSSMSGVRVNDAYIRTSLTKYDRETAMLLQDARSRFNPQQLEALAAFRKQMRVQLEARLWNMARTMTGQ